MTATTALVTAAVLGLGQAPALAAGAGSAGDSGATSTFDAAAAQTQRQDQCLLSTVLRMGGPAMKQVAADGLNGDAAALHASAAADFWDTTPLSTAFKTDNAAASTLMDTLSARHFDWEKPLSGLSVPGGFTDTGFEWAPKPDFFDAVGLSPWAGQRFWTQEDGFYDDPTPLAGDDSAQAATALGNARYPEPSGGDPNWHQDYNEWSAWQGMTSGHKLFADDTRLLLEGGGFPRTAPAVDTVEFRVAVEDLKSRFASCEWRNPVDPNGVLGQEVQTASTEWQAEIAGQQTQRDAIFAANGKATAALATGAQALGEALGQSWLADHLSRWEAYWLAPGAGTAGNGLIKFQLRAGTTLCLDDSGGSATNGNPIVASTCTANTPSQQWEPTSGDVLDGPLVNFKTSKCLYVTGGKVELYTCNSSAAEHWQYVTTQGVTRLYNVGTKLCANFAAAKAGQAATAVACDSTKTAQQFVASQDNAGTGTGTDALDYPTKAQFSQAKAALTAAQAAAKTQATLAQAQSAVAQQAVTDTAAAEQSAYAVADTVGVPRGRGLLAGQQEAQVTMASAAALKAVAGATQTAYQATTASASDADALQQLAQTQGAASKAAFREAAAQEADVQAKAAAAGAALQAKSAAAANATAQKALGTAQQAEATAKQAADVAHAKRLAAEAEQAKAAADKKEAAADQGRAAADQTDAEQQSQAASNALAAAQSAGATAANKRQAAQDADKAATQARNKAWDAEQNKNALVAKAQAADAHADAEASSSDATEARSAADRAGADAADATTAANRASADAGDATAAAQAADAAATRAEAAASRSQADANDAQAAKATADAAVRTDEAAVATAIQAAGQASDDAAAAKKDASDAQADAVTARQDAVAAGADAQQAQADAATTAGYAYTTAQAATAASNAAQTVAAPANDAVQLGSPYVDTDSSAGLAVLTAQASKTIADQQQAVAQAKADQSAQAAKSAQALADAATGDAKNAQVAAADAAAQAAAAQVSAQQAIASAAQAEKAAAEAKATEAQTIAYDAQATADASAAQSAADAAAGDAADARASANQAESDAAAAQSAASAAQDAAATARQVAAQADQDAAAAEAAAQDAEKQAASAQQAATQAEREQNAASVDSGGATGIAHMFTTEKVTPIGDPKPENECVLGLGNSGCDVKYLLTFTLTVDFYLCNDANAPANVTAAGCPAADTVFLGSQSQQASQEVTHHFSNWDITKIIDGAILQGLWDGLTADFVNCSHGSVSGCLWAATWFVPQTKIANAIKAIGALDDAMHTGVGIADAWKVVQDSGLGADALAQIEEDVKVAEDVAAGCAVNSFPPDTQVLLADGSSKPIGKLQVGDLLRATDPETGASRAEPVAASFTHGAKRLSTVVLAGGGRFTTTLGHRLYVVGHGWKLASDLRVGDLLRAADGSPRAVTAVHDRNSSEPTSVYDLTVTGLHTFYVLAGHSTVLVHNCDGIDPTTGELDAAIAQAIDDQYGSDVAAGVERMVQRMHDGSATAADHVIPGVGHDPIELAKYLQSWEGRLTYRDTVQNSDVVYDTTKGVLVTKNSYMIHAFLYSEDAFKAGIKSGRYAPK
ncbi:ricin-type beta-trefoil lectin domain protein [Actinacidiphila oryziradicis]|uniref:ricin-type beta-trefoil lectin domain protein n=1 Tax=Actinacidiphila oryziradicis TaxID=2571141 RepID=UPI00145D93F3|nr:ricin-type beta-trefoil lectin domain protein [Actinacidiphila oryziradicis]